MDVLLQDFQLAKELFNKEEWSAFRKTKIISYGFFDERKLRGWL